MKTIATRVLVGSAAGLVLLASTAIECAAGGLSDLRPWVQGWDEAWVWYDKSTARNEAESIFIDGDVGRQLRVEAPWFECENGERPETKPEILSGSLPPGVTIHRERGFEIAGVPQQRGKWTVRIRLDPVYCGNERWDGFTQDIEFRIGVK